MLDSLHALVSRGRAGRQELLRVTAQVDSELHAMCGEDVTAVAVAFAKLRWRPTLTLQVIVQQTLDKLEDFQPGGLIWCLWALGRQSYKTQAMKRLLGVVTGRVLLQQSEDRGSFSGEQLCTLCWVMGRCSYRNKHLLDQLTACIVGHHEAQDLRPAMVSNAVWACAKLGHPNAALCDWAAGMLERGAADAAPQAVANTAWGLWRLGAPQAYLC